MRGRNDNDKTHTRTALTVHSNYGQHTIAYAAGYARIQLSRFDSNGKDGWRISFAIHIRYTIPWKRQTKVVSSDSFNLKAIQS